MDSTQELDAMRQVALSLDHLDNDARTRVIAWIAAKYGVRAHVPPGHTSPVRTNDAGIAPAGTTDALLNEYGSLAEFFDAADPGVESEKALVVGLWMQRQNGADGFDAAAVNRELKHLGHGVANITAAFNNLMSRRPALAMQTAKGGKSQQARKKYKITRAGEKAVAEMLGTKAD